MSKPLASLSNYGGVSKKMVHLERWCPVFLLKKVTSPPLNTSLIEAIVEVIMIWLYGIQQSYSLHTTSIAWLLMKAKESGKKSYYDYNDFSWEINAIK